MTDLTLPILGPGVQLPANVRDASPQRQEDYRAALSFERSLLAELTKQLNKTTWSEDEDVSAATKAHREQLPGILADALVGAGGIGIAATVFASTDSGAPEGEAA